MIPRESFIDNLALIASAAANPRLYDGAFVECGTWRGGMSAAMIEVGGWERHYCFFDSFAGLPPAQEIDGDAARKWQSNPTGETYFDNCTARRADFESVLARAGAASNVRIFEGLFNETVETAHTGPIALLRLDGDWYDSIAVCLNAFWEHVLPDGLIIIDDYGIWDGCTRAVHDFLSARAATEAIERYGATGVCYIRKRLT